MNKEKLVFHVAISHNVRPAIGCLP